MADQSAEQAKKMRELAEAQRKANAERGTYDATAEGKVTVSKRAQQGPVNAAPKSRYADPRAQDREDRLRARDRYFDKHGNKTEAQVAQQNRIANYIKDWQAQKAASDAKFVQMASVGDFSNYGTGFWMGQDKWNLLGGNIDPKNPFKIDDKTLGTLNAWAKDFTSGNHYGANEVKLPKGLFKTDENGNRVINPNVIHSQAQLNAVLHMIDSDRDIQRNYQKRQAAREKATVSQAREYLKGAGYTPREIAGMSDSDALKNAQIGKLSSAQHAVRAFHEGAISGEDLRKTFRESGLSTTLADKALTGDVREIDTMAKNLGVQLHNVMNDKGQMTSTQSIETTIGTEKGLKEGYIAEAKPKEEPPPEPPPADPKDTPLPHLDANPDTVHPTSPAEGADKVNKAANPFLFGEMGMSETSSNAVNDAMNARNGGTPPETPTAEAKFGDQRPALTEAGPLANPPTPDKNPPALGFMPGEQTALTPPSESSPAPAGPFAEPKKKEEE